jgi:hypothetical protein
MITFSAFAQRGENSSQQNPPPITPLSSFAGYFDTGMLPTNRFSFDLPFTGFDYGVTENFTIGTNSVSSIIASLTLQPLLYLKTRYRFFSNKKLSSVLTGYGGYFYFPSQNNYPQNISWFLNFTNNTSYFINKNNILNFHLTALKFSAQTGDPNDKKYLKISLDTIALGVGYQTFFTNDFGIEGQLLYSPYFNLSFDNPSQQSSLNLNTTNNAIPFFIRILANYKTGEESNLTFGYWNLNNLVAGPWLGWQVLF